MNLARVGEAKNEAKRFLRAVAAFEARARAEKADLSWQPTKEGGALKRASLDLTRALAAMRVSRP